MTDETHTALLKLMPKATRVLARAAAKSDLSAKRRLERAFPNRAAHLIAEAKLAMKEEQDATWKA